MKRRTQRKPSLRDYRIADAMIKRMIRHEQGSGFDREPTADNSKLQIFAVANTRGR